MGIMKAINSTGIVGYGAYIPRYRLPASEVARVWAGGSSRLPITRPVNTGNQGRRSYPRRTRNSSGMDALQFWQPASQLSMCANAKVVPAKPPAPVMIGFRKAS